MNGNLNVSKVKRFLKNKNTVTALCAILIVVVLIVGYTIRVNNATKPVKIPVAKVTIQPRTEITADMITEINVPQEALKGNYYRNVSSLVGKYSNVNTVIPVAQSIDFVKPELVLNDNKVYIESPLIIDEKASEKIQQIINSMGDNHEE